MKTYQIYTYGKISEDKFCRMIFLIDDSDQEQFLRAETKRSTDTPQLSMGQIEAVDYIKANKLKLIDKFKTRL